MTAQAANTRGIALTRVPEAIEENSAKDSAGEGARSAIAFAEVGTPAGTDAPTSGELDIEDAWKLISLCLPRGDRSVDGQCWNR